MFCVWVSYWVGMHRFLVPWLLAACSATPNVLHDSDGTGEVVDVEAELHAAGMALTDAERVQRLEALREMLSEADPLASDLDLLLPDLRAWGRPADFWVAGSPQRTGEDGVLGGFFLFETLPDPGGPGTWPTPLREDSPLQPIRSMMRARALVWAAVENGFLTDAFYADAEDHFDVARAAFPDHPILDMYQGTPIPWTDAPPLDPSLPDWANDLHTALSAQEAIASWWVEHQLPDGQFGGGWGDDVEMWRKFTAVLLAFEDTAARPGFRALAEGAWAREEMADGYLGKITDVEHGAEESGDTTTWMLQIDGDEIWPHRARHLVDLATAAWWGTNEDGRTQFRASWLGAEAVSDDPAYACDTTYHTRVLQPALLLWLQGRLDAREDAVQDWLGTWVAVAASSRNGKPTGLLPSAIHWPSGRPGGPDPDPWWNPVCHTIDRTFQYPRALSPMMRTLVQAAHLTGDDTYLAPVDALAAARNTWAVDRTGDDVEGSEAWAAERARRGLRDAMAKHWRLTGEHRWPTAWDRDATTLAKARTGGSWEGVDEALAKTAEALRWDMPARTSEVRFTDRVFELHGKYLDDRGRLTTSTPDLGLLYELVTGDLGDPLYAPTPAVRWTCRPVDVAPRVTVTTPDRLEVELVWFGPSTSTLAVDLLWAPGEGATWTLTCGDDVQQGIVEADRVVSMAPAPGVVCDWVVEASANN